MKFSKWIIIILIFSFLLGGTAAGLLISYLSQLPQIEKLEEYFPPVSTLIYAKDGQLITQMYQQRRMFVPLAQVPKDLIDAFLAVEDADFYLHHGVDIEAVLRAFYVNFKAGKIKEGGSTITQQLAKVLFLTPERSLSRKIKEAILAIQLEHRYTKNEILELYLNQIYLGNGAYGVESAARTIFGKGVKELILSESALIAGLPSSPNRYSPQNNFKLALKRRDHVLRRMLEKKYISEKEFSRAISSSLSITTKGETFAPYFIEYIRQYLEEKYGADVLYKDGLQVYTTLEPDIQRIAERTVIEGLKKIDLRRAHKKNVTKNNQQPVQGGFIVIDPQNGFIKALIGGRDFNLSQFNRATQAKRQPGSAIKPIIYTAAIDNGCTAADIIIDSPFILDDYDGKGGKWRPENFTRQFYGPTTLRSALERSQNVVTVKLLNKIGLDLAITYARKMGIKSYLAPYYSLALGSSEVSLLELTSSYAVLANGGFRVEPIFIRSIKDREGKVLEECSIQRERVISPQTAYILTSILHGAIKRGTGRPANVLPYPLAGKTGTTDRFVDAWFIGYCSDLVAGVWVGLDNGQSLGDGETGAKAACPIWVNFMGEVLGSCKKVSDFKVPGGLSFIFIDPDTGLLADGNSPVKFLEVFKNGTEPKEYSTFQKKPKFEGNDFYLNFIE